MSRVAALSWMMLGLATLGLPGMPVGTTAVSAGQAPNVAEGRPYTLSVQPNYEGARAEAGTVLTDGIFGDSAYWSNGTTLGWIRQSPVITSISLAAPTTVSRVQVQAGAKTSGEIYYPSQILVYGSDGAGRFAFLGQTAVQRDDQSPSAGALRQFEIEFPPQVMREIVAVAFSRGRYLFLGEVAAFADDGGTPLTAGLASLNAVQLDAVARRRVAIASISGPPPSGPAITQRWAMPLGSVSPAAGSSKPDACEVSRIEPWPDKPRTEEPIPADAPLIAPVRGRDYAAFRIANNSGAPIRVAASATSPRLGTSRWYALAHVSALDYSWVPDVVAPFESGTLPARSSITVLAEVAAGATGDARFDAVIDCGGLAHAFSIPVRGIPAETAPPLYGNLWTYLHEQQHLPVTKAIACEPDFLSRFGIDSVVVHPNALLDDGGPRPAELLARYFRSYRQARRVLLFMDVRARPWTFRKMPDPEAAGALRAWWDWVQSVAKAAGVEGEIILYPIDEPRPSDVALLLRTRDLFRAAGVTAKVYATAEQKTAPALQSLDIVQLHRPTQALRDSMEVGELQSYDTRADGKLLSVNGYYRMQGWQAYQLGLAGIGVWSAWDSSGHGDPASGWDPFVGTGERDFGMLYVSPDGCGWPSRRLLAWRRGLEEYRLLRACAKSARSAETDGVRTAIATGRASAARQALERMVQDCAP